jgi:lysozyme family protein
MLIRGTSAEAQNVLKSLSELSSVLFQEVGEPVPVEPKPVDPEPVKPTPVDPKPEPVKPVEAETDFYKRFLHLVNVKKDWALSADDSKKLWDALVAQANDKTAFNKRVALGVQPSYGNAQCATTTASVIEGAAIAAGLTKVASIFDKDEREKNQLFALTHQIEIALRRLGFTMWDKKLYVAPRGAICMMAGRYNFAGCKQHSGHVYTMNTDQGPDSKDIINDNGGFQHLYANYTESFFLPAGITPVTRTVSDKPVGLTVSEIQAELNEHFDAQLEVDGKFGPRTMSAIKQAETFLKMVPDGKPDVDFISALISLKGLVKDITPAAVITGDTTNPDFQKLWDTCEIKLEKMSAAQYLAAIINKNKDRYTTISSATKVPWQIIGVIHLMESNCNFKCHLHNGDPLTARTVQVPADRPKTGNPPFTFEESAIDALGYDRADQVKEWGIVSSLRFMEAYNGLGYRSKGIYSPYLWSYTNHYVCGKYIADGVWSKTAVSDQCGVVPVLKLLGFGKTA